MSKNIFLFCTSLCCFISPQILAQYIKGTYAIKNKQTGMLLRVKDANSKNGTPLVAYPPTNWKCMTWEFKHIDGVSYQLKNLFTGKTFQLKSTENKDSVVLEQQPLMVESEQQQYEFILIRENIYFIKLINKDLYLTPADKHGTIDTGILLKKKDESLFQQWIIYEQKPSM